MQLTNFDIMGNRVRAARHRLDQHRMRGQKSDLSVFEAARLMDVIRKGEDIENAGSISFMTTMN